MYSELLTEKGLPRTEGSTRSRTNPPPKSRTTCCLKNLSQPEQDQDPEDPQAPDTPLHYQDMADELSARDLPQHLQVYTGLRCAVCGAPTIWRVDLWRTSPLEWYQKTIRDAELGIRLARKDAPRLCPSDECRLAARRRNGQKAQQDPSIRAHLQRPDVVAKRKEIWEAKRRWTLSTKQEQRRQQVLAAKQNDIRVFPTRRGGSYILSNAGWDSLYLSGLHQAQTRIDAAIQAAVPLCHTLPLSDQGTRHDSENKALQWFGDQPLPLMTMAAEPLNAVVSRLTLSGLHTKRAEDLVSSYHPTNDLEVFTDVLFTQVKSPGYLHRSVQHCLAGKEFHSGLNISFNQQFAKFSGLRRELSNQLLDYLTYNVALSRWSPNTEPLDPEYCLSLPTIRALRKQQVQFSNLQALKNYLQCETERYLTHIAQYFEQLFPLEAELLAHTATLAWSTLEACPEVTFSAHSQVVDLLQDALAQAKIDLDFDVRPRALFARWRRMKKFSYLKLPAKFSPTPVKFC